MKKKLVARLWSDESGASAIELALISAVLLVPLLLGATELGRRIWMRSQLDNALRVGMEYVMIHGASNATDVQNAARSATALGTAVTVSPPAGCGGSSYACYGCPTSSGVTLGVSQTTTCTGGGTAGKYAGLTATISYTPLFHGCGGLVPATVCPLSSGATSWSERAFARIQ